MIFIGKKNTLIGYFSHENVVILVKFFYATVNSINVSASKFLGKNNPPLDPPKVAFVHYCYVLPLYRSLSEGIL